MMTERARTFTKVGLLLAAVWLVFFNAAVAFWACVPQAYHWVLLVGHACTLGVVLGAVTLPHWLRWFLFAGSMFYFRFATMHTIGVSDISPHMLNLAISIVAVAVGTVSLMWATSLLKGEPVVRTRQFSMRQLMLLMACISFALAAWLTYAPAMPVVVQRLAESHNVLLFYTMFVLASVGMAIPLTAKSWWGKLIAAVVTCAFILLIPNSRPFVALRILKFRSEYGEIGSLVDVYMMIIAIVALNIYVASWAVHALQLLRTTDEADADADTSEPGSI